MTQREYEAQKARWWDQYYKKQRSHFVQTVDMTPLKYAKGIQTEFIEEPKEYTEIVIDTVSFKDQDELDLPNFGINFNNDNKSTTNQASKSFVIYDGHNVAPKITQTRRSKTPSKSVKNCKCFY